MVKSKENFPDITLQGEMIDKERIAHSFSASIATYETCATVQTLLADGVVRQVAGYGRQFSRGLEIGCGTGYLSKALVHRVDFSTLYLNDLSRVLCNHAAERLAGICPTEIMVGDIEKLALPPALDLVVSSSTLQWLEDMEGLFVKVAASLERDGLFVFSLFGVGTMKEIAALSGRGLRYRKRSAIAQVLQKYFSIEQQQEVKERLFFPSALSIFKHIRNTGVGGLGKTRWTRASLKSFETEYRRQFGTEEGLPVSYCAYIFAAKRK